MTRYLLQQGVFQGCEFGVVDVGVSGGLDNRWAVFGDQLRGWGFDPLLGEIERLNAVRQENVTYHACWVGYKNYQELIAKEERARSGRPLVDNDPGLRFSVWNVLPPAESTKSYDASGSQRRAERRIDLDDFFLADARHRVDFIKTDTDGHDYEVLLGAAALIKESPVLGVQAECNFHGPLHPHAQVFANLDRLMREAGFSLFDMSPWRYSRAALPSKFVWGSPGPTDKGQLWWADFLYFRDLGDPAYEQKWGTKPSSVKVLKLACCLENYDLADCAAELLLKYEPQLALLISVPHCLDLLTPGNVEGVSSYQEFLDRFRKQSGEFLGGSSPARRPILEQFTHYLWNRGKSMVLHRRRRP